MRARRVLSVLAATGLASAWLAVGATSASAGTPGFTVPAGVCQVTISAWGADGEGGSEGSEGGDGGRIQAAFPVTEGQVLDVIVAAFEGDGFNDGGTGQGDGADGGASSAVVRNGTPLIIAGGGGGGGQATTSTGGAGGVATSFLDIGDGQDGSGPSPGQGGAAQGTPDDGGNATLNSNGGGGGAGADPGTGSDTGGTDSNGGGGGGGNKVDASVLIDSIGNPGDNNSRDGDVLIEPAEPGVGCDPTLQVAKSVVNTSPGGFVIEATCVAPDPEPPPAEVGAQDIITVPPVELPYLADGTPDEANGPPDWFVADGVWQLSSSDLAGSTCNAVEIEDAGALEVSYECAWEAAGTEHEDTSGCPDGQTPASGPSAEPQSVTFEQNGDVGLLTVTNTFGAESPVAIELVPTFTG